MTSLNTGNDTNTELYMYIRYESHKTFPTGRSCARRQSSGGSSCAYLGHPSLRPNDGFHLRWIESLDEMEKEVTLYFEALRRRNIVESFHRN